MVMHYTHSRELEHKALVKKLEEAYYGQKGGRGRFRRHGRLVQHIKKVPLLLQKVREALLAPHAQEA